MPTSTFAPIICCRRTSIAAVVLLILVSVPDVQAETVAVSLDAEADPTSHFISYFSAGIVRLDLTHPVTDKHPFWNIDDLSQTYNANFDFFPNDNAMRFGELTYDDSSLNSGSGTAIITGLTLGIEIDPLDSSYLNGSWLSFSTDLQSYSGSVTVVDGAVTGIELTADYAMEGIFGGTPVYASGEFTVSGNQFAVLASGSGTPYPQYDPSVEWDWTGTILAVSNPPTGDDADFNGDGIVNLADYTVWRNYLGAVDVTPYSLGDADGDGQVTAADYQLWKAQFGGPPPASGLSTRSPVPEPDSCVIIALAAVSIAVSGRFLPEGRKCR